MGVSADGGTAAPLTDLNVTELKPPDIKRLVASMNLDHPSIQRTAADFFPALLSDGRYYLYFRASEKLGNGEVCLGTLESDAEANDPMPLVTDTLGFVYMPSPNAGPGYLLFLREQTPLAQLFDENRLELLGDPLPVADKVGSFVYRCFFSASSNGVLVYRSGIASQVTQATLFDRQRKKIGTVGEPGTFYGMAFSPDGEEAALGWERTLVTTALSIDIWLFNLSRGTKDQFTFGQGLNTTPLWSPDGTRIVFGSLRDGVTTDLYQRPANGATQEELLLNSGGQLPTSWSSDGQFLLFARKDPETKNDLWILPVEGDRKPEPVLRTKYDETDGRFSPNMHWIAYVSDELGSYEVYVREFSPQSSAAATESGARWRVSLGGGKGPRWRRDGRELYYRAPDGSVMAVEITADPAFRAGTPKTLFSAPPEWSLYTFYPAFVTWDVSSDGNRFLLPVPIEETAPAPFTVVLNWTSLLKQQMPVP
jgi:hypothetical protein